MQRPPPRSCRVFRPAPWFLSTLLAAGGHVLLAPVARADLFITAAADRGWYSAEGDHDPTNRNYVVGSLGTIYRQFFVFDLPDIGGIEILSAELRLLSTPGSFSSPDGREFYRLALCTLPASEIIGGGRDRIDLFEALSGGTVFAEVEIAPTSDDPEYVRIPLNAAFLALLTANPEQRIVLGGSFPNATEVLEQRYAFAGSDPEGPDEDVLLVVETIPAPGSIAMVLGASLVMRGRRR